MGRISLTRTPSCLGTSYVIFDAASFPFFTTNRRVIDYTRYLELLEEAKYFQISRLETWLQEQTYLQAMKIEYSAVELDGANSIAETMRTDMEVEYHPVWKTQKVYVCPRGIYIHRGDPGACGKLCQKAKGNAEDEYVDEEVLKTLVIRKRTVFDQNVCLEER